MNTLIRTRYELYEGVNCLNTGIVMTFEEWMIKSLYGRWDGREGLWGQSMYI